MRLKKAFSHHKGKKVYHLMREWTPLLVNKYYWVPDKKGDWSWTIEYKVDSRLWKK